MRDALYFIFQKGCARFFIYLFYFYYLPKYHNMCSKIHVSLYIYQCKITVGFIPLSKVIFSHSTSISCPPHHDLDNSIKWKTFFFREKKWLGWIFQKHVPYTKTMCTQLFVRSQFSCQNIVGECGDYLIIFLYFMAIFVLTIALKSVSKVYALILDLLITF